MSDSKHENYEILNLIGYGLAKFDMDFVKQFGYQTKNRFSIRKWSIAALAKLSEQSKIGRIYLIRFFRMREKAGGKKGDCFTFHRKDFY